MTQRIRLWKVAESAVPEEVPNSEVRLEKRLEDWLERDISMLDPNLLVVGRQVGTPYGGRIDLLCIDQEGYLVVVELKGGRTPRDVAAQTLDYASWVKDLNADDVAKLATEYDKIEGSLEDACVEKFGERPDDLCERHRSIIVAEAIDDSTERIVRYLSELGVPINIARMHAFRDSSGQEMLAQVFLVEPEVARDRAHSSSKSRYLSPRKMQALADANNIGPLYRRLKENVTEVFKAYGNQGTTMVYRWKSQDNRRSAVLMVEANTAENESGGMLFVIHATRCCKYLRISIAELRAMLPANVHEHEDVRGWGRSSQEEKESADGLKGSFRTLDEVDKFVAGLREAKQRLDGLS